MRLTSRVAVLLALFDLGAAHRAADTEDVAMRAAEILPRSFRWKRYPEQIDLELVRLALKNCKMQAPPLVDGGVSEGWQLTPAGMAVCASYRQTKGQLKPEFVRAIRSSSAFRAWKRQGVTAVGREDLLTLLRVNDYFPNSKRRERVIALMNDTSGEAELASFVAAMRERFPEVMAL
jgi:hypothetical protein